MGIALAERSQYRETGSRAFNIENERPYSNAEMKKDSVSYLSEYRLRVQMYDYEYQFSFVEGEGYKVRDIHRGEAMSDKAKRTLEERKTRGLPIHRELAELSGLAYLDKQMLSAADGDRVFWISPPGPKEEGYGDYGFVYEGRVHDEVSEDGLRAKRLFMTAIRIENPTIPQCNNVLFQLTGENASYINAEGLLKNPRVVKNSVVDTDSVLQRNFSFVIDQKEALVNKEVIGEMDPMIDEFVGVVRSGSKEEKITAFHALENYALELKKQYARKKEASREENVVYTPDDHRYRYLVDILSVYGYKPPVVLGSCGSTGDETRSNDIFADNFKNLMKAIFGDLFEKLGLEDDEWFVCKSCHYKATGPIGDTCPGCHITKEEYAKKTGEPVCE